MYSVINRQVNGEPTTCTYDKLGRILTLTHKSQTTAYTWDAASRLTQKTLPNNIKQQMVYDDAKLVPLRDNAANNTVLEQFDYAYDARGRRISKTTLGAYPIARDTPIQATYNVANRLTSLTLVGAGAPATVGGQPTNETYALTYDDNGNLTEKRGQGAIASNITTFSWDKQNQLIGMTQASANAATNITASFSYDQFGRRTNKTINGEAVNYVYDGDQAVGESSSTASTSQLTGMGIDEHIARYTGQDQLVYLTDALGSIIAQTKADGSFQNKYGYSPYGQVAKDADDKGNPHQFTGRENDNTGLMFYRARYYMPSCGRFISEDPIGTDDGLNVYAYVGGDPVNARDPTGNCGWTDAIVGFGDAFGAGLIRHLLGISDGDVDKNSGWYNGGMIGGTVWGAVPFALTGGAAVGATREGHLLNHNRYFRIGPGRIGKEMVPRVSSPYLSGRNGHYELATRLRPLPPLGGLLPKGEGDGPDCD